MRKNKQSARSLTAFLVTWAFVVLTVTGLVLYVVPQGRVAYWTHWSLAGMEKEQWGWVHMMFGGVFIVTGVLHLYFNWKPFKGYFAERIKGHFALKREIVVATVLTVVIFVLSAFDLPPASWVIDLNTRIKDSWITSPELEPPFGHAEEASLAGLARRTDIDLAAGLEELRRNGVVFEDERDTLEKIARRNDTTPMAVYALLRRHERPAQPLPEVLTAEDIEARFSGTGLGRKTLKELAATAGFDLQLGLQRLARAGIEASADDNARELADRSDRTPIELLTLMMLP